MSRVDLYPNIEPSDDVDLVAWENDADLPKGGRVVNLTMPVLVDYLAELIGGTGAVTDDGELGTTPPSTDVDDGEL
jgi:hypothetical protein